MAGKPPEEGVMTSGSWLDRQPFSAGGQAGWHAAGARPAARQAAGAAAGPKRHRFGKIPVLVPEVWSILFLTPELNLLLQFSPSA